jgi:hypothetical protein
MANEEVTRLEMQKLKDEVASLRDTVRTLEIAFAKSIENYNRHIAGLHVQPMGN